MSLLESSELFDNSASSAIPFLGGYCGCSRIIIIQTRSGPKIPAVDYLEGGDFLDLKKIYIGAAI